MKELTDEQIQRLIDTLVTPIVKAGNYKKIMDSF